jgi:CheY-like chemotaxis protein
MSKKLVVVVDDNEMLRKLIVAQLSQAPELEIDHAGTGAEGLEKALDDKCAVVVLDMMLPDMDGVSFVQQLRDRRKDPPCVIAMTAASASAIPDWMIEGPHRGVVSAVFRKPFDHDKLRETVLFCVKE